MSNELALLANQLPATQSGDDADFERFSQPREWNGRLQLFQFTSGAVKDELIKAGRWGVPVSDAEILDLGASIDIVPLARRVQALDFNTSPPVSVYDVNDAEFQRIEAASRKPKSNCQAGICFLVFERSQGRLLEYFCGNMGGQLASRDIGAYMPLTQEKIDAITAAATAAGKNVPDLKPHGFEPCTLTAVKGTGQHKNFAPSVTPCSLPFANLPPANELMEAINKFCHPAAGAKAVSAPANQRAR